ncbi:uncharacterized protein K02A2.6-like [Rhopilema esculentum]|uniref:uncharacterized protein K02A2.6-like n=1 Tax=Rhopilema esculentum TaxID=499914 RepID=UPI0031DCD630
MEQSDLQTKKIEQQNGAGSSADTMKESFSDLNKIRPNKYQHKGRQANRNQKYTQQREQCGRCGMKNHNSKDCRVTKGRKCMKCGIMGHFAKCCKTKNPKKPENHQVRASKVTTESSSDDETSVFKIGSKERPVYPVYIDGTPINMLIDSGSTLNIIDEISFQKLPKKPQLESSKTKIFTYLGKEPLKLKGTFRAKAEAFGKETQAKFYVTKGSGGALLGQKTAEKLDILRVGPVLGSKADPTNSLHKSVNEISQEKPTEHKIDPKIQKVLDNNREVFEGMGKFKDYKLKLHIDENVIPVQQPIRRLPYHTRKKVSAELERLLKNDCIEKVKGPSTWINPIVVVPKPNGTIRLCLDMRRANEAIVRERHQIPKVEEILPELHNAKYFSKIDLKEGYHQLELAEESRHITTFLTHEGCFQSKRLVYGVSSAFEQFQKVIEQSIAGCPGTRSISDDILIWSSSRDEMAERLDTLFKALHARNLKINPKKCVFGTTKLTFAGYCLTDKGIHPDKSKVDAVNNAKVPTNATEVRSFLGLVNFCSHFIKDYATLTEPLRKLTRKETTFAWNKEQQASFTKLKESLTNASTMAYYQPHADTEVIVDASPVGLGAILTQKQQDGQFKPVAYASHALSPTEQRYSQTEREGLAAFWSTQKFHYYLYDREFTIVTDHKPLEKLLSARGSPTPRLQRWLLKMQPYKFTVQFEPGHTNASDVLSRSPLPATGEKLSDDTEHFINSIVYDAIPKSVTIEEIQEISRNDEILKNIKEQIKSEKWSKSPQYKPYFLNRRDLWIKDDIILKGTKLIIPTDLRQRILATAHQHHLGIVKTKGLLREKVWWPGIDQEVENLIKHCHACQVTGSNKVNFEPLEVTKIPSTNWHTVALDIQGPYPTKDYLIALIDYRSRYPVVAQVKTINTKTVIKALDKIFSMFGYVHKLVADNGKQFISDEFKQYLKQHGIKLRNVTPYSPWVNGEVERFNRSLKKANQCAHAEGKDWREELNKFLLLYRTTPHATTGQCPATVFFGRGIKNDIPEYAKDGSQDTELDRKDREKKGKMKNYTDIKRNAKDSEIQEQDTVLVKNLWKNDKLSPNWLNEKFKVIKIYRKSALLENERGNKFYRNKAHLKKYNESESNRQAVPQKENTHNTDEEEDILAEELLIDNAQNVARPTRSERRPNRAITNANDANNTPHLNENNNSSVHESDNADMHQNSENRFKEGIVEDHWNKQSNEDIQEDIGNRTPVFVPDSVPTAIQEQVQVKKFPIRRSRKKKN